jgi:hypothetical protein
MNTNVDAFFLANQEFPKSANHDSLLGAVAILGVYQAATVHHRRGMTCHA